VRASDGRRRKRSSDAPTRKEAAVEAHPEQAVAGAGFASQGAREQRRTLLRVFAVMAVSALCLAALVSIVIFLFGSFGETERRLLATALAVAGYSLTGLAATTRIGRRPVWLGPLGIGVSGLGFVLAISLIWTSPEGDLLVRLTGSVTVLAIAIAHASLLLPHRPDQRLTAAVLAATLVMLGVLAAMLIVQMLFALEPSDWYLRWMGVVAVLTVLGTLLVPILRKVTAKPGEPAAAGPAAQAGEAEAEAVRMMIQFSGRTFEVQATYREAPLPGYAAGVWEISAGGKVGVPDLPPVAPQPDPYTAMSHAVLHLMRAVRPETVPSPPA
jgi:hypothetical protein